MNITLLGDYKEDGWMSMDVYTSMLLSHLRVAFPNDVYAERVAFPHVSSWFPKNNKAARYLFRYLINPIWIPRMNTDIYHITDQANAHLLRVLPSRKTVITCHDIIVPYWYMAHGPALPHYHWMVKQWRMKSLKRAARVISVSETTKRMLMDSLNIDEEKIRVIREGVDPVFYRHPSSSISQKMKRILPRVFVLHVGTNEPHKNVEWIFSFLRGALSTMPDVYFVKVGAPWSASQRKEIRGLGIEQRVIYLGTIPKNELAATYRSATSLVQPSFIEGFGLTVLEAMASGCPVIASDVPALQELAKGTAIYINPRHPPSVQPAAIKFLVSRTTRQNRAHEGMSLSRTYSWKRTAQETHEVYAHVLSETV